MQLRRWKWPKLNSVFFSVYSLPHEAFDVSPTIVACVRVVYAVDVLCLWIEAHEWIYVWLSFSVASTLRKVEQATLHWIQSLAIKRKASIDMSEKKGNISRVIRKSFWCWCSCTVHDTFGQSLDMPFGCDTRLTKKNLIESAIQSVLLTWLDNDWTYSRYIVTKTIKNLLSLCRAYFKF